MRRPNRDPETLHTLISDRIAYLKEQTGVCAEGSVNGYVWIRYVDGEWRGVRYGGQHRRRSYVDGTVFDEDDVRRWMENNPVRVIPVRDATVGVHADTDVWEDAAAQDVFSDADRCFWCGVSDTSAETHVALYETIEHGEIHLCDECKPIWDDAGELVSNPVVTEPGSSEA